MRRTLVLLLSALLPRLVAGQVVVVDEGTFTLLLRGTRVGREDFSIRRAPPTAQAAYVAQANVLMGESRVSVATSTDSLGLPLRFQHETVAAGQSAATVTGEWRGGLWSGRAVNPLGESAREFRLTAGTIAVEPGVMHHLWFLLRFAPIGRRTTLLLPRTLQSRTVRVEAAGSEAFAIGLSEIQARRFTVRIDAENTVLYEAWVDPSGRLLRVRIPGESLEAVRDEAPPSERDVETLSDEQTYAEQSLALLTA
jgi:hypothetical protein